MICLDSHLLMSWLLLLSLLLSGSIVLLSIAILAFCQVVLQGSLLLLCLLQKQHRNLLDSLSWDIALLGERFALCRCHVLAVGSLGVRKGSLACSRSIFDLVDLVEQVPDSSKTSNDVAKFVKRTLRLLMLLLRFHQLLSVHDDPLLLHVLPRYVQVARSRSCPRPANLDTITP